MTKSKGIYRDRYRWQAADVELLRRHYADSATSDLATAIGCTVQQVYRKADSLGLKKGEAFLATSASGRTLRGGKLSQATQFKPGLVPWNAGVKGLQLSPATQFKPGQKGTNWMPLGSYRTSKEGYLQIKVQDTGYPPRDWMSYHRHVWEQAHGPLPAGHIVVFRPGAQTADPEQITLDRLECISRAENMRRNTFHRYGPEVAKLVQLRGALSRQINKRAKEANTP